MDIRFEPIEKRANVIAVVGIHGAGKSSALPRLGAWLRERGHAVVEHPNESLRPAKMWLEQVAVEAGYRDEVEMLGIDTAKLCASLLKWNTMIKAREAMERPGGFVLMDRYTHCQIAAARQFSAGNEWLLRQLFSALPEADLIFYLDISPREALRRIDLRAEDTMTLDFLETLDAAYRSLPEAADFVYVDAEQSPDDVVASMCAHVEERFALPRPGAESAVGRP
jgi:dTMP kinase